MSYVIGVDLGTSAVKLLLVNRSGVVVNEVSRPYPLIQEKSGHSEQDPEDWVRATLDGLRELAETFGGSPDDIEGISFSGQMHGLVLLDNEHRVLRNAILWNDTRTTEECREIEETVGLERLLAITKNRALEGFTLPKLLWVRKHEPDVFEQARYFLLPKDYVRYRMTGSIQMERSDAAGTLLLDIGKGEWSEEMCRLLGLDSAICPELTDSHEETGTLLPELAAQTGLSEETRIFAGGADNACGAIGAGILEEGKTLCSIGTSGVILAYEQDGDQDFGGKVHYFNHADAGSYYTMGVTLSAGHSLSWLKETFARERSFDEILEEADAAPPGAEGLLFTPYLSGERTPYVDAKIRGSFIGMNASHRFGHFARAVLEGITFSLNESIRLFRENGKTVDTVVSVGGGAKNALWLQMQADVFDAKVIKLKSEQGPSMGAAMLAAVGCGWFDSLKKCAESFLETERTYEPDPERVAVYRELFAIYKEVYPATADINRKLHPYRS
ncbi:xylulokinase [Bhargavaea ginsengi]|uniref:xylulokinase n=1 Tax=Bhargavaea ginsengi TaxID=426757 RepID=UPI00203CBD8A|nr:xylulokinase [Bhargavaea ginsengi]MCM3087544.1 xylulokinase [Bhargavaea ginsengi]